MRIGRSKRFLKNYESLDKKIQIKADEKILLFCSNPFHSLLNNHKLTGSLVGLSSINVTGDYRILFREYSDGRYELVELINIGTHSGLYK